VGVLAGRACLAPFLALAACLPRDDLSTHSGQWGIDFSGGAGASAEAGIASDAGNDSSESGGNGGMASDASVFDGATGGRTEPDGGGLDGSATEPDAAADAAAGVLGASENGG
jgi:hypothetical protein